jgi:hypothetical protein
LIDTKIAAGYLSALYKEKVGDLFSRENILFIESDFV